MGLAAPDLTSKQAKLAEVVASGAAKTVSQAAELAQYSHRQGAGRALQSVAVQREIAKQKAEKRSTASAIREVCQTHIAVKIRRDGDNLSLQDLAGTAATMAKIEEAIPEQSDSGESGGGVSLLVRCIHRAFQAGYSQALRGRTSKLTADLLPQHIAADTNTVR